MSGAISTGTIGLRSQQFHEGLKDVGAFGPKEAHLRTTVLVGKVACLTTHLKGLNYVDDLQALTYLAAELGISSIELDSVLREMEELDFAKVVSSATGIKRIELKIPELRSGYEDLGERWLHLMPSEIERASIVLLENVASFPRTEVITRNSLGLDAKAFSTVLEIGSAGALIDKYEDDRGEVLLYSPLTVEEKPDTLLELAKKYPQDHIIRALREVQANQGSPLEMIHATNRELMIESAMLGAVAPVQIRIGNQDRTFLFTPRGGLRREERVILEKARAILACVRCGQHYAQVRPIIYPRRILETLRDSKGFAYSRPDFPEQYGLLVTKQIGYLEHDRLRPGFYHFHLYDTPENIHALEIAIDLLEIGQPTTSRLETDAREFLSVSGTFTGTLPTRSRMNRTVTRTRELSRGIIDEISKLARGIVT